MSPFSGKSDIEKFRAAFIADILDDLREGRPAEARLMKTLMSIEEPGNDLVARMEQFRLVEEVWGLILRWPGAEGVANKTLH